MTPLEKSLQAAMRPLEALDTEVRQLVRQTLRLLGHAPTSIPALPSLRSQLVRGGPRPQLQVSPELAAWAKGFRLEPRGTQALSLLLGGMTRSEICQRLGVTMSTMKTWMRHILWRTGERRIAGVLERARREVRP